MTSVAFEASGLLTERPTGIGTYGRHLVAALSRRQRYDYTLVHAWERCRRRRCVAALHLPVRSYLTGSRLEIRFGLLHALDTKLPNAYHGRLVATVFDIISLLPLSASEGLSTARFRAKKQAAYAHIAARADRVVVLSRSVAEEVRERLKPRGEILVVPPGVDFPEERGTAHGGAQLGSLGIQPPFVLFVGALCPRKNLLAVARAFRRCQQRLPELQLVVVGEPAYGWQGSEAERELGDLRARLGPTRVVTLGYLPRPLLWEVYTAASALLYLSHYEGFGLPVVEAQSVGTPVVASRRGGIVDAAGGEAWLVEPDDEQEIDGCLEEVLSGAVDAEARVRRARVHAREFSWERVATQVEEIYAELLPAL